MHQTGNWLILVYSQMLSLQDCKILNDQDNRRMRKWGRQL